MLKILWTYILFLLFISASARAEKPWYFDAIGLPETPMSLKAKKTPGVVLVVFSEGGFLGVSGEVKFSNIIF
ncbi:peptidase, partial [Escherichia coli]